MIPITIPTVRLLPGTIRFSSPGTPFNPSIAEATEMGGVMIPSASKVAAPMMAGIYAFFPYLLTRANKENIPPSPLLSACKVRIDVFKSCLQSERPENAGDSSVYKQIRNGSFTDDGLEHIERGCSNISINNSKCD